MTSGCSCLFKPLSCLHRSFVYLHALQTIHPTFTIILLRILHPERAVERGTGKKCGAGKMISLSQDKLGFVSLKVPHLSYDFVAQGMDADLATGKFQVRILSEPPTILK